MEDIICIHRLQEDPLHGKQSSAGANVGDVCSTIRPTVRTEQYDLLQYSTVRTVQ